MYSMASWSPSQSEPLTVSYMWKRQLSPSPILPSEAAMPPCAATVWLRGGNTFLTHPACLQPRRRHSERRPKPGTTRADDHHVIAVLDDFVCFGHGDVPGARCVRPPRSARQQVGFRQIE